MSHFGKGTQTLTMATQLEHLGDYCTQAGLHKLARPVSKGIAYELTKCFQKTMWILLGHALWMVRTVVT